MLKQTRAWGSRAISVILALGLMAGFSGFYAQAEEVARQPLEESGGIASDISGAFPAGDDIGNADCPALGDGADLEARQAQEPSVSEGAETDGTRDTPTSSHGAEAEASESPVELDTLASETSALAEPRSDGAPGRTVTLENKTLYANGIAVVIKKDSDGNAYVYDGSGTEKLIAEPCTPSTVYGGSKNAPVDGDTSIRIEGVSVGTVYGGGYSDGTGIADVSGSATVTITGNVNANTVYGGGYATASKGDASANVAGRVTVSIPAEPTGNHNRIYGGGNASAQGGNDASATAGSVKADIVGRLYAIRGGGTATVASGGTGSATADVAGAIELACTAVDAREIYGAGYASGNAAHATAGSVAITVDGDDAMIIQSGGQASSEGNADVLGSASTTVENCSNLYGYILGGGYASSGGTARVGSSDVTIRNSIVPVYDQGLDELVAAATYAGGSASGAGSDASVLGSASLCVVDCEGGGNLYGGGEASGGGRATVGDSRIALTRLSQTDYKGTLYSGSIFAGGESDDPGTSVAEPASISVTVEDCFIEHVWGGLLVKGSPESTACESSLELVGADNHLQTLTCFDRAALSAPLAIEAFKEKADGVPTELTVSGVALGEPVVICEDDESFSNWFSRKGGSLVYAVEEIDGKPASVWRMGEPTPEVPDPPIGSGGVEVVVPTEPGAPAVSVPDADKLADDLLTEEDRKAIDNGASVSFAVRVAAVEEPPAKIAETVERALAERGQSLAAHLDICLYKSIDGAEAPLTSIEQTGAAIRFCIGVPEGLVAESRAFAVMRFHEMEDGTVEVTELEDIDEDPSTVTFETDRFSVYSLVYKDEAGKDPNKPANPDDPGKPGDGEDPEAPGDSTGEEPSDLTKDPGGQDDPQALPQSGTKPAKTGLGSTGLSTTGDLLGDAALLASGVAACAVLVVLSVRLRRRSTSNRRR